jgi:hypothetical protein
MNIAKSSPVVRRGLIPFITGNPFAATLGWSFRNQRALCSARATPGPCQKRLKTARTSRYSGQTASPDDTFVSPSQKGCPVEGRRHDIPSTLRHRPLR